MGLKSDLLCGGEAGADNQSVDTQGTEDTENEEFRPGFERISTETRCLHPCVHGDPEKTELGFEENCPCAALERG
jgi:hypothetical protein